MVSKIAKHAHSRAGIRNPERLILSPSSTALIMDNPIAEIQLNPARVLASRRHLRGASIPKEECTVCRDATTGLLRRGDLNTRGDGCAAIARRAFRRA